MISTDQISVDEARATTLRLRPWEAADAVPLIEAYRDPELLRWTHFHVDGPAAADEWLAYQRRGWAAGERFSLVVEEVGETGAVFVGNVALKTARLAQGVSEVGYWTAPWARGRGVASAAVIALSRWAFATFELERLELRHQLDNEASCRVAVRAGFRARTTVGQGSEVGHVHSLTRDA